MSGDGTGTGQGGRFEIERVFDAPRETVFRVWSDPDHFRRWAAPTDFTVTHLEMDFRVGGIYRICLRSPAGTDYWIRGYYQEIVEPERFSLTNAWKNESGETGTETLLTVRFEAMGDRTKIVLTQEGFVSEESRDSNMGGWSETLDSLIDYLSSQYVS